MSWAREPWGTTPFGSEGEIVLSRAGEETIPTVTDEAAFIRIIPPKPDHEEDPTQPAPRPVVVVEQAVVEVPPSQRAGERREEIPALLQSSPPTRRPRNAWASDVPVSRPRGVDPRSVMVRFGGFAFSNQGLIPDITESDAEEVFSAVFAPEGTD